MSLPLAYNLREAAPMLGLTRDTLRRRCESGAIAATKTGCQWLITPEAIEEFLRPTNQPDKPAKRRQVLSAAARKELELMGL